MAFILPQNSTPFRYSGAQCYQRIENAKFEKFFADTGVDMEAGCGIDTTVHRDGWRQVSITTEIACCEFTPPVKAQGSLFDLLSVTSEYEDEGQNLYFDVSQDCLIVDEKASRRGRIDSEGAGAKLCGKSTADSRRVGA
ncbi:MAG: hypothetical protein WCB11_28145 [Terriglobales bacterium]|jgi:hypothetical protein